MKSVVLALLLAAGCSSDPAPAAAGGSAPPPHEVSVETIAPRAVTLVKELPGRTSAFRVAEVRARVNGIVLRRNFEEQRDQPAGVRRRGRAIEDEPGRRGRGEGGREVRALVIAAIAASWIRSSASAFLRGDARSRC
ncbi:MAG: hypothetical protein ACKV2T_33930 [Kofleriaceae bacterium]